MRTAFRVVCSLVLIFLTCTTASAQQPRRVLFETFTNSFDQCPAGNGLDAAFKRTLASGNGTSVIHLNNHIGNVGDPMVVAGATANQEILRIGGGNSIFNGAVDHTVFSGVSTRVTTMFEPSGETEWNTRINERLTELPLVAINLVDIRIDKIGQADYWRLIAKLRIRLQDQNGDSLRLFYAITEDNVLYKQCESTKPVLITSHNNVVRFIDVHGVPLALKDKAEGTAVEATITHDISREPSYEYNLKNMKLIAWVERGTENNFEVVQAWEVRKNFDTLQAPPPEITISNVTLDGKTYAPEDNIFIKFDKTSVDSVKIEFSSDGGTNWQLVENINNNRYFWKAPDITTTQGKIRISELKTGTPSSTSSGFFTIETPFKRIKIIKPQGGDTAFLTKKFTIEWSKTGTEIIEKVDLDYSVNGGAGWAILAKNQTGTTFNWNLFGPIPVTEQALIRITEVTDSLEKVTTISDPFYIMEPITGGGVRMVSKTIADMRVYPQPLSAGNALSIELTLTAPENPVFTIYDMLGKEVYHERGQHLMAGKQIYTLQVPSLATGAYILSVEDAQGGRLNRRLEIR